MSNVDEQITQLAVMSSREGEAGDAVLGGSGDDGSLRETGELCEDASGDQGKRPSKSSHEEKTDSSAGFVSRNARLYRNFKRSWETLNKEFIKDDPSSRYLAADLQRAEGLVSEIREKIEDQKQTLVLENSHDWHEKLEELEDWEQKFDEDVELLANVSSWLERNSASASYLLGSAPVSRPQSVVAGRLSRSQTPIVATGLTPVMDSNLTLDSVTEMTADTSFDASASGFRSDWQYPSLQATQPALTVQSAFQPIMYGAPAASTQTVHLTGSSTVTAARATDTGRVGLAPSVSGLPKTDTVPPPASTLGVAPGSNWGRITNTTTSANHAAATVLSAGTGPTSHGTQPRQPTPKPSIPAAAAQSIQSGVGTQPTAVAYSAMPAMHLPPLPVPRPAVQATVTTNAVSVGAIQAPAIQQPSVSGGITQMPVAAALNAQNQTAMPMPQYPQHQHASFYPKLKPLKVPKFSGQEKDYLQWRQRFLRTVNSNPWATDDHKLDRLRESTEGGKAESLIAGVIDGPGAYQEAWHQLEAWFGGQDRHLEKQIRSIMDQRKITSDSEYSALQAYAIKLQNALSNLKMCGSQPGPELYILATERIPKEMLMKFFAKHGEHTSDVGLFSTWLVTHLRTMKRAADRVSASTKPSLPSSQQHQQGQSQSRPPKQFKTMLSSESQSKSERQCRKCQKGHHIDQCNEFKALPVNKRWDLTRLLNLCACCLGSGHWANECKKTGCSECSGRHHELLHRSEKAKPEGRAEDKGSSTRDDKGSSTRKVTNTGRETSSSVTFMTVNVKLKESKTRKSVTALLDSGSNCSYVTEELATRLNLTGPTEDMETTVLGGNTIKSKSQRVTVNVCHSGATTSTPVSALVIPSITSQLDPVDWNCEKHAWQHLSDINFATPKSDTVDMLIGLDAAELHVSYEERRTEGGPIARRTPLGWLCFGPQCKTSTLAPTSTLIANTTDDRLDSLVKNMWELEAVGMAPPRGDYLTPAEKEAEQMTTSTMCYESNRYQVGIPWIGGQSEPDVQCERSFAERRLNSLVAMLAKKPEVRVQYSKVLEDYLKKGYVRHVTDEVVAQDGRQQWFLPHFPVVRNDRATTKVRVVFDAAAECRGVSINSKMHTGPKLQNDLVQVLLRFCAHPVAIAGDISEMFLQVQLQPADRKFHRFLWKESASSPVMVFEFLRLAFGMRASPYLAGRALKATADDSGDSCSDTTRAAIRDSFYVDDFLHSRPTASEAATTRAEVQEVVAHGGFSLRKWTSNSKEVMKTIPLEEQSKSNAVSLTDHAELAPSKTLGVTWSAADDSFSFAFPLPEDVSYTRRGVLRQLAKLFDPRGQIQPFTIRSRVLFQEVCIRGKDWDEPLDDDHHRRWQRWFSEFPELSALSIDRSFRSPDNTAPLSIHTFVDASEYAYAAAVYVRQDGNPPRVTLAMARARPAPIKKRSIPMLELQGAVLGARLTRTVAEALDITQDDCHFWTDSMNVLYWVRSPSRRFKMDVGRRIAELQELSTSSQWNHVPGRQNPADKATRGLTAVQLATDEVWFHGPQYLADAPETWPKKEIQVPAELPGLTKSRMPHTFVGVAREAEFRLRPERYSSWSRLTRVTAWCLRVCRRRRADPSGSCTNINIAGGKSVAVPELSPQELEAAERHWIRFAQVETYPEVIAALERKKDPPGTVLEKLQPTMEKEEVPVMRVGGRLKRAQHLPHAARCPIILPRSHRVTALIIDNEDRQCKHSVGTNHLLSNLGVRYWIVKGKAAVKQHRSRCVSCKKARAKAASPQMGPLPDFRTSGPLRAFSRVGVDYAGPFLTRQGRGRVQTKRYVCIFSCLQTRACHFELTYSLDTDGMLLALARFMKRRGVPAEILSDNGSNFVAADREMREALERVNVSRVTAEMAAHRVKWRFNPPAAPHFGGVFETVVKSMKRVLQSVLYRADLSDEELHTALVQAESLVNSRPLTTLSSDAEDLAPLTPQHFLVGQMDIVLPIEDSADGDARVHPRKRWLYVQSLVHTVWKRWLREFVPQLNVRVKWHKESRNIAVDDIVLVVDKGTPRARWSLGRIVRVHPGVDGVVRVVDVKVSRKIYRRPVNVLVPLEVDPVGSDTVSDDAAPDSADVNLAAL